MSSIQRFNGLVSRHYLLQDEGYRNERSAQLKNAFNALPTEAQAEFSNFVRSHSSSEFSIEQMFIRSDEYQSFRLREIKTPKDDRKKVLKSYRNTVQKKLKDCPHSGIKKRAEELTRLLDKRDKLCANHPGLDRYFSSSESIGKGFEEKLTYVVMSSSLNFQHLQRVHDVMRELIEGDYSIDDVKFILKLTMNRSSFHPTANLIEARADLMRMKTEVKTLKGRAAISVLKKDGRGGKASLFKHKEIVFDENGTPKFKKGVKKTDEIKQIRKLFEKGRPEEGMRRLNDLSKKDQKTYFEMKIGAKFKPLYEGDIRAEVISSLIGDMLGAEMTSTTTSISLLTRTLDPKMNKKLLALAKKFESNDAKAMKGFRKLPKEIQEGIIRSFGRLMRTYYSVHNCTELFEGDKFSNREKADAIRAYASRRYTTDLPRLKEAGYGVFQRWINGCEDVEQFLNRKEEGGGGSEFKELPTTLIHTLILQNLLTGQGKNGHQANTLVIKKDGKVANLVSCDNEYTMPFSNKSSDFKPFKMTRIWALGMPQARKPISKALILALGVDSFDKRVHLGTRGQKMSGMARGALFERSEIISSHLAKAEKKSVTPLDLFYAIYGHKKELKALVNFYGMPMPVFEGFNIGIKKTNPDGSVAEIPEDAIYAFKDQHQSVHYQHNLEALYDKKFNDKPWVK